MEHVTGISFRQPTVQERDEIEEAVTSGKRSFLSLVLSFIMIGTLVSFLLSYFNGNVGYTFGCAVVFVILSLVLLYEKYVDAYKKRALVRGNVSVADVICTDIHSSNADNEYHARYTFQTHTGQTVYMKRQIILKDKPYIGKNCKIVSFGKRYFAFL